MKTKMKAKVKTVKPKVIKDESKIENQIELTDPYYVIKPNSNFDNLLYWINRTFISWRWNKLDIDLLDGITMFEEAHKLNMTIDQYVEKILTRYVKKNKHLVTHK